MLYPKKVKFRKWQKNRQNPKFIGAETRGTDLSFGSFGLKATSYNQLTSNQIESARKVIARSAGKTGRIWIRVFPDRPFTQKAAEVPMGKGKGEPQGFCVDVLPGRIIFEIDGIPADVAREALRKAGTKLPVKAKVVARAH
ncbi:MAG: 50S ribosomal protein L16 [Candidatus Taylorbacteria bacterium]|nr:50S ribosomal protein L16 [Candidatus Taylorbacteria bacterium]